jgi:hypothetical protein
MLVSRYRRPAADVTAHSLEENTDRKVMSGDDGSFLMENLKPGRYQLTAANKNVSSSSRLLHAGSKSTKKDCQWLKRMAGTTGLESVYRSHGS